MQNSMKRSLKSRQIGLVETYHLIDGVVTTPVDKGFDKKFVSEVVDNGTGDYTIKVLQKSKLPLQAIGVVAVTPATIINIEAVDEGSITVNCFGVDGTTPKDAVFYITLLHSTQLNYTF